MTVINDYHAHIYFDQVSSDMAVKLCRGAGELFPLSVGHHHRKLVGPHPCWSCQLSFEPELFGEVIPWLALNRNGLTIFTHPSTGDHYKDHTDHAIWMGKIETLNLSMFQ